MFIFNFKVNGNLFSKILFVLMLLIIIGIFIFGFYLIFFKKNDIVTVSDTIKSDEIFEITESNYTNILKAANENIDSYIRL